MSTLVYINTWGYYDDYENKDTNMTRIEALEKAIEIAGGQAVLARRLNLPPQNIHNWTKREGVPDRYVLAVEQVTGVSRHELCPDWKNHFQETV